MNLFKGCSVLKNVKISGAASTENYNVATSGSYSMLTNANGTQIIMAPTAYPFATGSVFNVPAQSGSAAVQEIAAYSYANNTSLNGKEVVIPEGITTIGKGAFRATGITKVVIPSTVTVSIPSKSPIP